MYGYNAIKHTIICCVWRFIHIFHSLVAMYYVEYSKYIQLFCFFAAAASSFSLFFGDVYAWLLFYYTFQYFFYSVLFSSRWVCFFCVLCAMFLLLFGSVVSFVCNGMMARKKWKILYECISLRCSHGICFLFAFSVLHTAHTHSQQTRVFGMSKNMCRDFFIPLVIVVVCARIGLFSLFLSPVIPLFSSLLYVSLAIPKKEFCTHKFIIKPILQR